MKDRILIAYNIYLSLSMCLRIEVKMRLIFFSILLFLFFACSSPNSSSEKNNPESNYPVAANFELISSDGDTISLNDYLGKVVYIFWFEVCFG